MFFPTHRILENVIIKFTVPEINDISSKFNEKITRSTQKPERAIPLDNGGNTVFPASTPISTIFS